MKTVCSIFFSIIICIHAEQKPRAPVGWKLIDFIIGDFNLDGVADQVLLCSDGKNDIVIIREGRLGSVSQYVLVDTIPTRHHLSFLESMGVTRSISELKLYKFKKHRFGYGIEGGIPMAEYSWNAKTKRYDVDRNITDSDAQ